MLLPFLANYFTSPEASIHVCLLHARILSCFWSHLLSSLS